MAAVQGEIQVRRDTSTNWLASNPVLGLGEPAFDSTAIRLKTGDGSTAWKNLGWATDAPFVPPPSTGWTALNSGSVTDNTDSRSNTMASAAGDNWRGEVRTLTPASSYTATLYFDWSLPDVNFAEAGLILRNSTSGSFLTYGPVFNNGFTLSTIKLTNPTTVSATYKAQGVGSLAHGLPHWLRIRDDATTRFYEYSYNNIDWILHFSVGRTDFITPDQIGWGISANNSGGAYTAITRLLHFSGVA